MEIPFNRPLVLGTEQALLSEVFDSKQFAGNGFFGNRCQQELEKQFGYQKALLTTSCTSALELSALLLNIGEGDEVIIPSYAFVTTANAFANLGAKIVFADSRPDHPSIDESRVEELITSKTKAIVALHYGGVACEMDTLKAIADKHSLHMIEDNAQGVGSTYKGKALGGIGTLGALSFHETKNIHCGEGGAILINNPALVSRAEIVWDMGTNRQEFKDGKVNNYGWVDLGSSFYPSAFNSAFLLAQIPKVQDVNARRVGLWNNYFEAFETLENQGKIERPKIPAYANHNGHTFYLITESKPQRDRLISYLAEKGIAATFHFQSLHRSDYFSNKYDGRELKNSDSFTNRLVRLPLFYDLTTDNQNAVIESISCFFEK
ncbi:MAG: dTDP-4-amino-4,6-dideoxygalactose transaminase [Flavobacteriales bacterium]|nr:dTDP-4-amino-4,6-dideoxygalactose transaminase [Flavobacteriales bacterium]